MKKANLDLIRARYDAVNAHDFDRFQGFYADDVVWRDPATPRAAKGPRAVRRRLEAWAAAVPDLKWQLEDLFGEGDKLCAEFTFTGRHRGPLADGRGNELPGTGKAVKVPGVGVYVVRDGKIVDSRIWFDLAAFAGR